MPLALPACQLPKIEPEVVQLVDELLETHTDAEVAAELNARGLHGYGGRAFTRTHLGQLRRNHQLRDRITRLRAQGLLTLAEVPPSAFPAAPYSSGGAPACCVPKSTTTGANASSSHLAQTHLCGASGSSTVSVAAPRPNARPEAADMLASWLTREVSLWLGREGCGRWPSPSVSRPPNSPASRRSVPPRRFRARKRIG